MPSPAADTSLVSVTEQVPSRQSARSLASRDRIVHAALTVFALKGYTAASMDDVCLAAGMSKGGLYHHFPTKRAVLTAIVDRLARSRALLPPFRPVDEVQFPPSDAVGRLLIEIWAEAARDAALRAQLRAGYESYMDAGVQSTGAQALSDILRIGALIQLLTRSEALDAADAARKLGIEQAA